MPLLQDVEVDVPAPARGQRVTSIPPACDRDGVDTGLVGATAAIPRVAS